LERWGGGRVDKRMLRWEKRILPVTMATIPKLDSQLQSLSDVDRKSSIEEELELNLERN
jgi:hypothetical protein